MRRHLRTGKKHNSKAKKRGECRTVPPGLKPGESAPPRLLLRLSAPLCVATSCSCGTPHHETLFSRQLVGTECPSSHVTDLNRRDAASCLVSDRMPLTQAPAARTGAPGAGLRTSECMCSPALETRDKDVIRHLWPWHEVHRGTAVGRRVRRRQCCRGARSRLDFRR